MNYEICKVSNYGINYSASPKCVKTIQPITALLNTDHHLHERLGKNDMLKLAVDVDKLRYYKPDGTIEKVLNDVADYCNITIEDISYTYSNKEFEGIKDVGSYHIVIPSCCMKSSLQKEFWYQFRTKYGYGKEIDADIFNKDCWFRLPNQTTNDWISKGVLQKGKNTIHKIIKGELEDFVLKYVEKATEFVKQPVEETTDEDTISIVSVVSQLTAEPEQEPEQEPENQIIKQTLFSADYKFIETCINNGLFENCCGTGSYINWIYIGSLLKSIFGETDGFTLWELLTTKYGTINKKNEYKNQFKHLKMKDKDVAKALNILKKKAKDNDPTKYRELIKDFKKQNLVEAGMFVSVNDKDAADYIISQIGNDIIFSNGTLYLKENNIYRNQKEYVTDWILQYILTCTTLYRMGMAGPEPFGRNISQTKNIRDVVVIHYKMNEDKEFVKKLHTTTKGKICFQDGVLDFVNKCFYTWEQINFEYYSCIQIPLKYAEYFINPDKILIKKIKDEILKPLFGSDINRALHFFARAMAGFNEDKNYGTYNGTRNSGKGILYALFQSFGDYLRPLDLSNLLVSRNDNKSQECSRMLYWLLDFEFTRLAISQETPAPEENLKINSKMLKKICSGGDTQTARRNYDRQDTNFTTDVNLLFMGNTELPYTDSDAKQQEQAFAGVKQFKTKEEIEKMRKEGISEEILECFGVKDPELKSLVQTEKYKNAFIYLIYSGFKSYAVPVKTECDEDNNNEPLLVRISKLYKKTGERGDIIGIKDLVVDGFDKKKIGKALEAIGIIKEKGTAGEYKGKFIYRGIRVKTEKEIEADDNSVEEDIEEDSDIDC